MSADSIRDEDPLDPQVILRNLPEREQAQFLRQYHEAVDAALDPAGYRRLQQVLRVWSLTAIATSGAGYYEELDAVREGTARTVPAADAVAGWDERIGAARAHRR